MSRALPLLALWSLLACDPVALSQPCNVDGDCDPDAICELGLCEAGERPDLPQVDAGEPPIEEPGDGGPGPVDDAGEPPAPEDAGVFVDAGAPLDAGPAPIDAGPPDPQVPAVFDVRPRLSSTGTISIEGSFATDALVLVSVNGGSASATVTAEGRAEITPGPGAVFDELCVTVDGVDAGCFDVERVPYALDLTFSSRHLAQASYARQAPSLLDERTEFSVVHLADHAYFIGGHDIAGAEHDSVNRAHINRDGTLGPTRASSRLATPREGACAVTVMERFIYVLGGDSVATDELASVERASLSADGALSDFSTQPTSMVERRRSFGCFVLGSWLYALGGQGLGVVSGTVERAQIQPDGSLGPFALVESTLNVARERMAVAVMNERVVIAGGSAPGGFLTSVEVADIDGDALGAFSLVGDLGLDRRDAPALVLDDTVFVIGGSGAGEDIERITFGATGVQIAAHTFRLDEGRGGAGLVLAPPNVFVLGGFNPEDATSSERIALFAGAGLGAFADDATVNAVDRYEPALAVIDDGLFVLGGRGPGGDTASVLRAPIGPGGQLGAFVEAGALTAARHKVRALVTDGFLYAISGSDVHGALVERAAIAGDTLGPFEDAGRLAIARLGPTIRVVGDELVVNGGGSATTERAPIADGVLGAFAPDLASPSIIQMVGFVGRDVEVLLGGNASSQVSTRSLGVFGGDFVGAGNLQAVRRGPGLVVLGAQAFLMGGEGGTRDLEVLQLDQGGTPTSISLAADALSRERQGTHAIVLGNFVWLIGSELADGQAAVERASLR